MDLYFSNQPMPVPPQQCLFAVVCSRSIAGSPRHPGCIPMHDKALNFSKVVSNYSSE